MAFEKSAFDSEIYKTKKEEDQFNELMEYVVKYSVTTNDIRDAYFTLCGVYEGEGLSDKGKIILEKMQVLADNGFPINRFAILVQSQEKYEKTNGGFSEFIDGLDVSDQEKRLLNSIVTEKRKGRLTIGVVGEEPLLGLRVRFPQNVTSADAGLLFKDALQKNIEMHLKDKKIEFSFEED